MTSSLRAIAVIVDVAKSRSHPDRRALQSSLEQSLERVNSLVESVQPLEPTVGDEFQAAYADLSTAVHATLLARLNLPEGVDCRFGLGHGQLSTVGTGAAGALQDGSAWWSAREAITEAHDREYAKQPFVRTWLRSAPDAPLDSIAPASDDYVNAYLATRDHLVTAMSARERRLLLGQMLGETQTELAEREGITQSAVSQNLRRSGATAVLAGESLVLGGRS